MPMQRIEGNSSYSTCFRTKLILREIPQKIVMKERVGRWRVRAESLSWEIFEKVAAIEPQNKKPFY